tara:strand:- start:2069 stop:2311 length:243 start_codon:yes stop_codon:yes gene_type:complete
MTFFHPNHSIMQTEIMDNIIDRDQLQDAYIRDLIYGMDEKSMEAFVYDTINDNLDKYSVKELIEEVEEYDPELLEESKEK